MNDIFLKELAKDRFCDLADIIKQLKQIQKCKNIKEKYNKKRWR